MSLRTFLFIILIGLLSVPHWLQAQTAGWQGRRAYLQWNGYLFPSVRHQPLPLGRWNLRNQLGAEYVLRPWLAVGAQVGGMATALPLEVTTHPTGVTLEERGLADGDFLRISSLYWGLRAKVFWPRPAGSLAPLGLYGAVDVNRHYAYIYEGKHSSQRTSEALGGYRFGELHALAVNLQVGNQLAIAPRWLLDIGVQTGVLFRMGYLATNRSGDTQIARWAGKRLLHHNGFNLVVGVGWLF
ncbi:MAG: hypothetical protein KF690_03720 [Bacteroidetes bacterium]|nr:hypothetical protein [Bacteroidota bacterium]